MPRTSPSWHWVQQKTHCGNVNPMSSWLSPLSKLLCTTYDTHSTPLCLFFFLFLIFPSFACSISKHFFKRPLSSCVMIKQWQLWDPDLQNNYIYSPANNSLHISVTKPKSSCQGDRHQPFYWGALYVEIESVIQDLSSKCFFYTYTLYSQK